MTLPLPPGFDRRVTPVRADLAAAALRGQIDAPRYAEGTPMRVVEASAPIHRAPQPDAPLDTEALHGETFTVYDDAEGWSWGQLDTDGYVGYLPSIALMPAGPALTHRVSVLRTFVYPGRSMKLAPVAMLSLGSQVRVEDIDEPFAHVDGGFIWASHLSELKTPDTDVVAVAEALVGTPYLWGGRTSLGLDCSALIQLSLAACGISAPRDSDQQQAALGQVVPFDATLSGLKRGDLVFWKGHVGILTDPGTLLHANGHHMLVVKEPLREAADRILSKDAGPITAVKRL